MGRIKLCHHYATLLMLVSWLSCCDAFCVTTTTITLTSTRHSPLALFQDDNDNINNNEDMVPPSAAENHNNGPNIMHNVLDSDERYPSRILPSNHHHDNNNNWRHSWGTERKSKDCRPTLAHTPQLLAQEAFHAIAATLYGTACVDPNVAHNAVYGITTTTTTATAGTETATQTNPTATTATTLSAAAAAAATPIARNQPFLRRPVRTQPGDRGRISIELGGTSESLLFPPQYRLSNAASIRIVSLLLAQLLAGSPLWDEYENERNDYENDAENSEAKSSSKRKKKKGSSSSSHSKSKTRATPSSRRRPIVIYFNTVQQALQASRELEALRSSTSHNDDDDDITRSIRIVSLDREALIPKDLRYHDEDDNDEAEDRGKASNSAKDAPKRRRRRRKRRNPTTLDIVDPRRGILVLVQPADYILEDRPPGPSIGNVESLQRLVAQAAIHRLPTIVVSPRYGHPAQVVARQRHYDDDDANAASAFVPASHAPSPWILRDFMPPVFSWIGGIDPIVRPVRHHHHHHQSQTTNSNTNGHDRPNRLALCQSVVEPGHAWNIFEAVPIGGGSSTSANANGRNRKQGGGGGGMMIEYQYLASTQSFAGRPTRDVISRIQSEFSTSSSSSFD